MPPSLTLNFFFFFFFNLFANMSVFSLFHALLGLSPPFPSLFSPSLENNQNRRLSFQSLLNSLRLHLSLFLPHTSVSLPPTKQIRQIGDGHGLSTKTNENNHFRLPTNNRLFSQRNRLISRYFVAIFFKEEINKPAKPGTLTTIQAISRKNKFPIYYVLNR